MPEKLIPLNLQPDHERMLNELQENWRSWWPTGRPTQSDIVREAIVEMYKKHCGEGDG